MYIYLVYINIKKRLGIISNDSNPIISESLMFHHYRLRYLKNKLIINFQLFNYQNTMFLTIAFIINEQSLFDNPCKKKEGYVMTFIWSQ